jgi:hypothetical protein
LPRRRAEQVVVREHAVESPLASAAAATASDGRASSRNDGRVMPTHPPDRHVRLRQHRGTDDPGVGTRSAATIGTSGRYGAFSSGRRAQRAPDRQHVVELGSARLTRR